VDCAAPRAATIAAVLEPDDPASTSPRLARGGPSLAARVIAWQARHGRNQLPWQRSREPYRVWLSEVMLQQTQVSTVLAYYERFVRRFPDVGSLAAAPLDDVLAQWSGLGYYSRARHLHRCAQQVVEEHGGRFPSSAAELERLPGIGRSTAAAIAVFCFGERAAILDGNVKRVLARVLRFDGDLARAAPQQCLWQHAQALMPSKQADRYTQGLMDLGAMVCHRRAPDCGACPLRPVCAAHRHGEVHAYPVKSRARARGRREHALLWLTDGRQSWLCRRPPRGVWAGLWSLPEWPTLQSLADAASHWPGKGETLPAIEHALTHFDWHLQPLRWTLPARLSAASRRRLESSLPAGRWFAAEELPALGLAAPVRRLLGA
jgi:A/G-specific adenine glycosylase